MPPIFAAGFLGIEHFAPPWDVFFLPLFNLLVFFYDILFSDFALAIIVFTILIRTLLAPLFVRQIRSQKEMQRMQPLIKEVQRKHKGNRAKISEETMALYKEHGVNPAGGCLPVVLQLPILWALYQALYRVNPITLSPDQVSSPEFAQLREALPTITQVAPTQFTAPISGACNLPAFDSGPYTHFLPLNCQLVNGLDLSQPINTVVSWLFNPFTGVHLDLGRVDHAFSIVLGSPETGFAISFLAILAAAVQFVQVKMSTPPRNAVDPTSAATGTMAYLFPLMTVFWGGIFPSGLILYWIVYTAYLIVQQFLIMGWGNLFPIFGWHPPFASPEPALAGGPSARRAPAVVEEAAGPPSTNRPSGARQPQNRQAKQQRSGQKRRGRKR
jgi:YidC/Oxa1 family membrane protein insertase